MSAPVVLILGAGANTGASIAKKFTSESWKVAAVARTIRDEVKENSALQVSADFSDPGSVETAYKETEAKLGTPNIVIYNAYSTSFTSAEQPFDNISVADFAKHLTVNVTSAYAAANLALEGFKKLPQGVPKVFIFTGNMEASMIVPQVTALGAGKNASLYFIESAAHAYGKEYQFYFADERFANGLPTMDKINGEAHAEAYWTLANSKKQQPPFYTFVKGAGYKKFDLDRIRPVKSASDLIAEAAEAVKHAQG